MKSIYTSHYILLFITVLIFGMAEASLQFTVPKASLKQTYLSDAPNLAWEGNLLIPASIGNTHTFFSEIHYINRMGGIQKELNTGLGYRYLANNNNLLGSYLFFDYNTTNSANTFNQITVGGEWFHGMNVIRGNVYVPLSTDKMVAVQGLDVAWQDQNNGTRTGEIYANEIREQAMYGTDVVAGRDINNFYVGIGGYYFWHKGYQEIAGPKLKVNYRVPYESKLIQGLKIESELSYDKVRGARTYAGVRVVFGEKTKGIGVMRHRKDFVERDIDIVTHTKARTLNYNDEMGTHYKIIESNTPPTCASGNIWKVSGTVTLNSTYTACSGSSIVGSNIPLPYKGTQYTIHFVNPTPTIQAKAGFTGDLITLDGGDATHNQTISGLTLINTNYANHTLVLTHTFFHEYNNIILKNIASNGRMSFQLPWTANVNLSFESVKVYVTGFAAEEGYTRVINSDGTISKYAPGMIELLGGGAMSKGVYGNLIVSKFKDVEIGNGSAMPYSALLISGTPDTYNDSVKIQADLDFSGQSINLQKNGSYRPALLFLGKNVTIEHDIILPSSLTLANATGVLNTINIAGTLSFNSNAPDTVNLTNITLIENTGSKAHIGTLEITGKYILNNSSLLNNASGASIDTVNQGGTITTDYINPSGIVIQNSGTITHYNINNLQASNRSSNLILVDNQTDGVITTLSFTGTNTFSGNWTAIANETDGQIITINQSGTLNLSHNGIFNASETISGRGIGNITLNGNINFTSYYGQLIDNEGSMGSITATGTITVSKETNQANIVYNEGKIQSITLNKVTDHSGLRDIIYNYYGDAKIGDITLGSISTDANDTMTYINNDQGTINSITINYSKLDTTHTIYVNNTNGTITDYVALTLPTLTGTDPVLPVAILPSLTKFINVTPQLNINADTVTVTRDTFLNLTTAFTAGWLIHDITLSNITYSGSNAGTVISIGSGVTVNSITVNNARFFNTGINNAGTITTATISGGTFNSDSGKNIHGIDNKHIIKTATVSGVTMNTNGLLAAIYNSTGGNITKATVENSSLNKENEKYSDGIYNDGTITTAIVKNNTLNSGITNVRIIDTATVSNNSLVGYRSYGIFNIGTITTALVEKDTLINTGNHAQTYYGIYNQLGSIHAATFSNNTFDYNNLSANIYGIYNNGIITTATLSNLTVAGKNTGFYGIANNSGTITTAILEDLTLDGTSGKVCAYQGTAPQSPLQHSNITLQNGAQLTC